MGLKYARSRKGTKSIRRRRLWQPQRRPSKPRGQVLAGPKLLKISLSFQSLVFWLPTSHISNKCVNLLYLRWHAIVKFQYFIIQNLYYIWFLSNFCISLYTTKAINIKLSSCQTEEKSRYLDIFNIIMARDNITSDQNLLFVLKNSLS